MSVFFLDAHLCRPAVWRKCARLFEKARECGRAARSAGVRFQPKVSRIKAQMIAAEQLT